MNKKLAILAPFKAWGGIERNIVILCREFLAMGVQPELVLTRGGQIPYPDELPAGVEVVDLRSRGKFDAVPKVIRYLRQNRPDAVLAAKDHAAKVAVVARHLGRLRIPLFIQVNTTLSQTLRRFVKRHTACKLYPRADGIIAVSQGVKDDMHSLFECRPGLVETIYNPVGPDIAARRRRALDHPWLIPGGVPVILGAGRLTPGKDFISLVRAFARLRQRRACKLLILGEGPERAGIEEQARDLGLAEDVELPGFVLDPIPWMARADVFVNTSCYEGFGNVLIEALAAGTPVVATDCPSGPAEILAGGRYGPLVPVGDVSALTEAIDSVLTAPPAPELNHQAVARFRSDHIARQYLEFMGLVGKLRHG